jgi:mono/diheme cytochrome c family protein
MVTLISLLFVIACDSETQVDAPIWYGQVEDVLVEHCGSCHSNGGIGTFNLDSYDAAYGVRVQIQDSVNAGRMPPWLADPACADYDGDISLSDQEKALISDWVDSGAPEGDPADSTGVQPKKAETLEDPDVILEMPTIYTPIIEPDEYRCFVLDWPETEDVYVVGYDVDPGNDAVVHHVIGYIVEPEDVWYYEDREAEDETEGYDCYGSPGYPEGGEARWLGGWAPGGPVSMFPEGTGIRVSAGSKIVLQMHYNVEASGPGPDQTRVLVATESEVSHPSIIQPWTNPSWLSGNGMDIPANSTDVTHSFSYSLPLDLNIYSASMHMHELGKSGGAWIDRSDGSETCLVNIPAWDFNWQRGYRFVEPVLLVAGDALTVECTWDNPTDEDIGWGDSTGDEMCLGTFLMSYP